MRTNEIYAFQKLFLTQVDSSSPPVFFYGSTETEVDPRKDRPKIDPRYRSDDGFKPSSLWVEPDTGPSFGLRSPEPTYASEPKIKPRRHNQLSEPRIDLLENEVDPREKVEARNDLEPDVEPRHDRMDDFRPDGGLVPVNDTMLRAVGLVQEEVT